MNPDNHVLAFSSLSCNNTILLDTSNIEKVEEQKIKTNSVSFSYPTKIFGLPKMCLPYLSVLKLTKDHYLTLETDSENFGNFSDPL